MAEVLWPIINDNCLHKYLCDEPKQSGGRTKHLHSIQQSINSFNEKWGERGAAPKSEDLAHRFERIAHFSTRRPFTKADLNEVMLLAPLALHTSARTHQSNKQVAWIYIRVPRSDKRCSSAIHPLCDVYVWRWDVIRYTRSLARRPLLRDMSSFYT